MTRKRASHFALELGWDEIEAARWIDGGENSEKRETRQSKLFPCTIGLFFQYRARARARELNERSPLAGHRRRRRRLFRLRELNFALSNFFTPGRNIKAFGGARFNAARSFDPSTLLFFHPALASRLGGSANVSVLFDDFACCRLHNGGTSASRSFVCQSHKSSSRSLREKAC